jgi:hypothetical protein
MAQYSEELFDKICNEIATSDSGLMEICKKHGTTSRSFYRWISENEDLRHKYTCAREEQAEFLADQIIKISNGEGKDDTAFVGKNFIDRDRLKVEARKWIAAKLKPKKYGDKIEQETKLTITNAPDWIKENL